MPRTARSVSGRGVRSEERDVRRGCHPQQLHPVRGRRRPSTKSGSDAPRVTGQIKPGRSRRPERRGAPAAPNPLAVTSLHAQYRPTVATGPVATSLTEADVWSALFAGSVLTEAQTHQFALCAITCPKALVRLYRDYERAQASGSAQQLGQVGACGGEFRLSDVPTENRTQYAKVADQARVLEVDERLARFGDRAALRGHVDHAASTWRWRVEPTPALPPPTHQSSRYEPSRSRRQGPPSPVDPVQTVVHQARELGARDRGPGEDESRLRRSGEGRVNETVLRTVGLHRGPVLRIGRGPQGGQCLQ
ncbi:hypothetical protein YUMDRAFT_05115 [Streptomyces sp. OspMP-M45]|nr:hypothetical protein YUMDRAFT_05115 [Streptomyces sp. OspMP-M45]